MPRHLPPLNSLRAFEAAARHLSFTLAAAELNVTQAAVSHQIKSLEDQLGMPLFRRLNRALLLTDAGQTLYPATNNAFDILATAIDRLHRHDKYGELTITTMDSFAASWLVPRLGKFKQAHHDIDVRLTTSDEMIDFARENVDMAIRYGNGDWPGVFVEPLMSEEMFPVCAPSLLQLGPPLKTPADLKHHALLHDDMRVDWRMWLMAAGEPNIDTTRGLSYQHSNLVVQAAEQGDGVALARSVLVSNALAAGRLVKPFDLALPANFAYYIVCPQGSEHRPKIKEFRLWLAGMAKSEAT
jgi:LysR family transcriptional regulator, glycine cleavage system transcriptional activator